MIGLGPHEMTAWLWAFSVGLAAVFAVLATVSIYLAARAAGAPRWEPRTSRAYPYSVRVVPADAVRRARADDSERRR